MTAIGGDFPQRPPFRVFVTERIQCRGDMTERQLQSIDKNTSALVISDKASVWIMLPRGIDGQAPSEPVMPLAIPA